MKKYLFLLLLLPNLSLATSISDFNPISHWTCDEVSGVRYDSVTANSNDLTDNNTVGYAAGLLSNACDFERDTSEYLSITDGSQTSLDHADDDYSVSFWIKYESLPPSQDNAYIIYDKMENASGRKGYALQLQMYPTNTYNYFALYGNADNNWDSGAVSPVIGTWYHVVVTVSLGTTVFYINGSTITQTDFATSNQIADSGADFKIGQKTYQTLASQEYTFDGLIDEFTMFGQVLTSGEVTTLYNSGTPLPYESTGTTSTSSSATSTSSTLEDDNIVFMLGIIVFFLAFLWIGFILSPFKKV